MGKTLTRDEAIALGDRLFGERFADANSALVAGSLVRGEGTPYSDIDLVVLYKEVPNAYRDSFMFEGVPIEAFIHDLETLKYFFEEVDGPSGCPMLPQMVKEGVAVPKETKLAEKAKKRAKKFLKGGPAKLKKNRIQEIRYGLTDLIDDLRAPRSRELAIGAAVRLYSALGDAILRLNGHWSAQGKSIPWRLEQVDPKLAQQFNEAFDAAFVQSDFDGIVHLTEDVLRPYGGLLFDGYRIDAPASWRISPHGINPHADPHKRPRTLAIALIKNSKGELLLHKGYDKKKDQYFYRPMGGGVDFGETAAAALAREFEEEIGKEIIVGCLVEVVENLFNFEGKTGHEVVFLYEAEFKSPRDLVELEQKEEIDIVEKGRVVGKAVWRSSSQIVNEECPLYPEILSHKLNLSASD